MDGTDTHGKVRKILYPLSFSIQWPIVLVTNNEDCTPFKTYKTIVSLMGTDDDGNTRNTYTDFWYGKYSITGDAFVSTGTVMYLAIGK